MKDAKFYNSVSRDRISSRQINELVGLARGLCADGMINQPEVEFLEKWLVAATSVTDQPMLNTLLIRISEILSDGVADVEEQRELFDTLQCLGNQHFELGECLKSTTLPLSEPPPDLDFNGTRYTFTGTFVYGQRADCERAVTERGGTCGSLTQKTDVLVIGTYATESWKHSSFGNKILKACEWRDSGLPIQIVSEDHWREFL